MDAKENRRKIHEIVDACLDANGLDARTREKTGTLPTVFFSFSGHVAAFEVGVHENGWVPGSGYGYGYNKDFWLYTDREITDEKVAEVKAYLAGVCGEKDAGSVLAHDIAEKEKAISEANKELAAMKRQMEELRKKGGDGDAENGDD